MSEEARERIGAVTIAIIGGAAIIAFAMFMAGAFGHKGASTLPCDRPGVRADCL